MAEQETATASRPGLTATLFGSLPQALIDALLEGSWTLDVEPGALVFGTEGKRPHVGVMLEGVARSYLTAADGRQLTVRYARPGVMVGWRSEMSGDLAPLSLRAVTACRVTEFDPRRFGRLLTTEIALARVVASALTARIEEVYLTVADTAFGSVRQRTVRHLLELAELTPGSRRVAAITQQQLADGVGTSREVVSRVLALLRDDGYIRTAPGEVELVDPAGLSVLLGEWRTTSRGLRPEMIFDGQALLDVSPDAVVAVQADGSIGYANPAAAAAFGWPALELIGRPIEMLVPERLRVAHRGHRSAFLHRPVARPMGVGLDPVGLRRDGSEFPVTVSLTVLDDPAGPVVVATIVDLSKRLPPNR